MRLKIQHEVPPEVISLRLDRYLAQALNVSRIRVMSAFSEGSVRVNGKRARKGDRVQPGSQITAEIPDQLSPPIPQPELPLHVLWEDPLLVVLDKPAGMASYPLENHEKGTVANALAARYSECITVGEDPRECGLAHRLDTETSGVMVAARNSQTYDYLRLAFAKQQVQKRYVALVGGLPGEGGKIDLPIAHHPKNRKKMITCVLDEDICALKARSASTSYRTLERLGDFALVEAHIPTGVTHQIRVHLAAIGAPVAGDSLYDGPEILGLARHFLHAETLAFRHPTTHDLIKVVSTLPSELDGLLDSLRASQKEHSSNSL